MYIDYLPLLQMNLSAGLAVMACWIFFDLDGPHERRWIPPLALAGVVGLVLGLHLTLAWPLPGGLNGLYGSLSLTFGALLIALAFVLAVGLDLAPVAVYAFVAGVAGVLSGVQVLNLNLGTHPPLLAAGLIWSGALGVISLPVLGMRRAPVFRILCPAALLSAAIIWGFAASLAFWEHPLTHRNWVPAHQTGSTSTAKPLTR